jgi:thiosulfate dehydrogenase
MPCGSRVRIRRMTPTPELALPRWRWFVLMAIAGLAAANPGHAQNRFAFSSPPVALAFPAESTIPPGIEGAAVRLGRALFVDTRNRLPDHVGNGLTCANCHLGGGSVAYAAPVIGLWGVFPEYRSRTGKIISLQERVNQCFERSMNGKPLPAESEDMEALLAYVQWASLGQPTGRSIAGRGFGTINARLVADSRRGSEIYAARCAACHGPDGAGQRDLGGKFIIPAVWGENSFNLGAGMARTYTAASFIRYNMPAGAVGTLSDQDAIDVAEFMTHQPRPDFPGRRLDWPRGDAPADARMN